MLPGVSTSVCVCLRSGCGAEVVPHRQGGGMSSGALGSNVRRCSGCALWTLGAGHALFPSRYCVETKQFVRALHHACMSWRACSNWTSVGPALVFLRWEKEFAGTTEPQPGSKGLRDRFGDCESVVSWRCLRRDRVCATWSEIGMESGCGDMAPRHACFAHRCAPPRGIRSL